jgi:murein DD-endopeptidase MepM/ murein hydrolase activator NlpD
MGFVTEVFQSQETELSKGEYRYPFPDDTKVVEIQEDHEAHTGPFKGAIDFLVPEGTPILASREGTVKAVVDEHDKHGPTEEFAEYLNFVRIQHDDGERSIYGHLAKGSALVKAGERVAEGQPIGEVGWSGWTDALHIHFFVSRSVPGKPGFKGLKPKFKGELNIS